MRSAGVADMYHTARVFSGASRRLLNFFSAVPYGLTADELCAWIYFGGGQALWDEVDAPFNIKPSDGCKDRCADGRLVQQGGQQSGRFQGLRYRMPGSAPRSCAAWAPRS